MDASQYAVLAAVSVAGYFLALRSIPKAIPSLFNRGIYGIDINKTSPEQRKEFGAIKRSGGNFPEELKKLVVTESLGIVVGAIYLSTVLFALLYLGCPSDKANAALCTITVMLLLGFVDDVLDLRWRYKIQLSALATIPLLLSYDGPRFVVVPLPIRALLGASAPNAIDLGVIYLVYIGLICIFCTNSINILAGVNGVEVGQSIVIAAFAAIHDVVQIHRGSEVDAHKMSLALLTPFIAASLALWQFNKYPSRVFVGDSYTYFAGMTLAVASVSGSYTKTMMLFFLPQLINFTLSIPQLIGIVECPRHRVPKWNAAKDQLENSRNLTILNAILWVTGPLHEKTLTTVMLIFQAVCCALAFVIRYYGASLVYDVVN